MIQEIPEGLSTGLGGSFDQHYRRKEELDSTDYGTWA